MSSTGALRVKQEFGTKDDTQHKFEPAAVLASSKSTQYTCLTFLADASLIITGSSEGSLAAYSVDGRGTSWAQEPASSNNFIEHVAAHPERVNLFAAAVQDVNDPQESYIRYCDIRTRSSSRSDLKKASMRTQGDILALAWHPDGSRFLLSHRSGRITMHDTRRVGRTNSSRPPELVAERKLDWELNAMEFTPDGSSILAAYGDTAGGGVRLLAEDLQDVADFRAHCAPCISIASTTHQSRPLLAVGCNDASISVWDIESMAVVRTITDADLPVRSVNWSSDGRYLAYDSTVSGSSSVLPWSAVDIAVLDSHDGIFGPLSRHRVEVVQAGRGLVFGGMAWSPGPKQQMLAFCGDVRDASSKHHKDYDPRSHLWCTRALT